MVMIFYERKQPKEKRKEANKLPKNYITEKGLKCLNWKYVRRVSKNCEIWRNGESKLIWNRVTLRFYMILNMILEKEAKK